MDGEDDLAEQEATVNKIFEERSATMREEIEDMIEAGKERSELLAQLRGNLSRSKKYFLIVESLRAISKSSTFLFGRCMNIMNL